MYLSQFIAELSVSTHLTRTLTIKVDLLKKEVGWVGLGSLRAV